MSSEIGGKIPLVGCPVRILSGPYSGQTGTVTRVTAYRERMVADPATFPVVMKNARARLGEQWHTMWYEAEVVLEGGAVELGDDSMFVVLDPAQTRGPRFKPGQ